MGALLPGTSIADILERHATLQSAKIAITHLKADRDLANLTYGELDRRACSVAAWLLEHKAQNQRVILAYPTGLDFIVAFFGCLYAGAHPVPLASQLRPRHIPRFTAVAADCEAAIALTDSVNLAQLADFAPAGKGLCWAASDRFDVADGRPGTIPFEGRSLAYLQYTSGSTSLPRGVRISHRNLMSNLRELATSYGVGGDEVFVSWLPHFHDMGLVCKLLLSVYLGARCVVFAPLHFLQRPIRWLSAISDFHGTFSAAPNFAYELCLQKIAPDERRALDLSSWRVALNGAEPVRAETHRRFLAAFSPSGLRPEAPCPGYGLAEATLMVSTSRPWHCALIKSFDRESIARGQPHPAGPDQSDARSLVGCGPPTEGLRVAIVDPGNGRLVEPGAIGEIWVSGDSVAEGYLKSPNASGTTFAARLPDGDGPWLRTGDLAFLHDGELFIAGRLKDLIIIHGRNLHPQDIEQTAQAGRASLIVGRGAAFGVDVGGEERLAIVQEVLGPSAAECAAIMKAIRAAVAQEHDVHPSVILLVAPGSIPVTSSGKLARSRTRDLLLKGDLTPVAEWYSQDFARPTSGIDRPAAEHPAT
jgi:acyl-CoA synthetase (AMP-forming)/AMP-acid ligase II